MQRLIKFHGNMNFVAADIIIVQVVDDDEWKTILRVINEKLTLHFGHIGEFNIAGCREDTEWKLENREITILSEDPFEIGIFLKWFSEGYVGPVDLAAIAQIVVAEHDRKMKIREAVEKVVDERKKRG